MATQKTVWIVDDDKGIQDVIKLILDEEGFQGIIIDQPNSVISRIQSSTPPDLILIDVMMSGVDGREVTKQLKSNDITKEIPVLIMTADVNADEKATQAMADGFIKKPFDIDDLIKKINEYI